LSNSDKQLVKNIARSTATNVLISKKMPK